MKTSEWSFAEGARITDELTAVRRLGGGSSYEAYLAFDDVTYGPVVVKVLRPHQADRSGAVNGLRREAAALEQLNHPVLLRLFRSRPDGEPPHLVLEHLEGPRLSTLLRRHGPLPEHQYLPLALELASVLHYLAVVDFVHLDVKPSNIIMGSPARLIDLSIARTREQAEQLTHPVGTDPYMAPEQCDPQTRGRPGTATDMWGVGATLFHAIEGRRPFHGEREADDKAQRFPQLVEAAPRFTRKIRPDVAAIVMGCLSVDPTQRPAPHELAEGLQDALAALPRGRLSFRVR